MTDSSGGSYDASALQRLERMGGNKLLLELIEMFLEHVPKKLDDARNALDQSDLPLVADTMHSLKSSAGMIGATGFYRLTERAELKAREGDQVELSRLLPEMFAEFDQTKQILERERQERIESS